MELFSDYLNDSHNFKQFIRKVKLDTSFRELNFNSLRRHAPLVTSFMIGRKDNRRNI